MAFTTLAFSVTTETAFDLLVTSDAVSPEKTLFFMQVVYDDVVSPVGKSLHSNKLSATPLPQDKQLHFTAKPGVYWITTSNTFQYSPLSGQCKVSFRAGKDPWPEPPPRAGNLVDVPADQWAKFLPDVGPSDGPAGRRWIIIKTVDIAGSDDIIVLGDT